VKILLRFARLLTLRVLMIVIIGKGLGKLLIFRGICLDNGTCDCGPFYSGTSCGTYVDCTDALGQSLCDTLVTSNRLDTKDLPNADVEDGGTNEGTGGETEEEELEPSRKNFRFCKFTCRIKCKNDCRLNIRGRKNRRSRRKCIKKCRPDCKNECLHLKPPRKNRKAAKVARIKTTSEATDGSNLLETTNETLSSNYTTIMTSVTLVILQFLLR
jgi:hypothetical protein